MYYINKRGFTLIELLIVVAIIAILAAIAIPNFLAAQVRAKVSRARGDMRSVATALESYYVDYGSYPLMRGFVSGGVVPNRGEDTDGYGNQCLRAWRTLPLEITTPISYVSSVFPDPFKNPGMDFTAYSGNGFITKQPLDRSYMYTNVQEFVDAPGNGFDENDIVAYGIWRLASIGPDNQMVGTAAWLPYDPTNGTTSNGDILRTQKYADGTKPDPTSP